MKENGLKTVSENKKNNTSVISNSKVKQIIVLNLNQKKYFI